MTTFSIRNLALSALAAVAVAGAASAQAASPVLNALEVRTLVASSTPADNIRLATHFAGLADQYTSEAARHTEMGNNYVGNPNRTASAGMCVHCKRLADLNTQSATTLNALAEHHQKLAAGVASTAPRNGS